MACAPKYGIASWVAVQQTRSEQGIGALQWDSSLARYVEHRAKELSESHELNHDGLYDIAPEFWKANKTAITLCEIGGRQPAWENPIAIFEGWKASPEHWKCVINPDLEKAAIASYLGSDGWIYEVMWLTD